MASPSSSAAPSERFSELSVSSNPSASTSNITTPAQSRPLSTAGDSSAPLPPSPLPSGKHKVAVIGSGSWGTALAKIAAENTARHKDVFDPEVRLWVRDKVVHGNSLIKIINRTHRNDRYLPDIKLPHNLVAVPKIMDVIKDATLIVFVTPHQFLHTILNELVAQPGAVNPGARALTAIKGVEVDGDNISTFASLIQEKLNIPCSALSGANIALEVAKGQFCETTIGTPSSSDSALWEKVFDNESFRVSCIDDVAGVSLSGALKNVVALAAGMVDGLNLGGNTKAAVIRIGLSEMREFCLEFFDGSKPETFANESAGIADLITTCYGGRNRKCAEEFTRTGQPFEEIEDRLLNGQKLQGTATAEEVHNFLEARQRLAGYPLFDKVYQIAFKELPVAELVKGL